MNTRTAHVLPRLPKLPRMPYIQSRPTPLKAKALTLCIAAICDAAKCIVAICDQQVSTVGWSADNQATKLTPIAGNWWLMWASNDISKIPFIVGKVKERLRGQNRTVEEVSDALSDAYQAQMKTEAERQFLTRLGLTLDKFIDEGAQKLTPTSFDIIQKKILDIQLGHEIGAFGFDKDRNAHILILRDPGSIDAYDPSNCSFKAIGSGQDRAESMLYFHKVTWTTPAALALYHACEAKFMAESALGVGHTTLGIVMQAHGGLILLGPDEIEEIRCLWISDGKPTVPSYAPTELTKIINAGKERTAEYIREAKGEPPNT